jgi:hypothetical protein
MQRRRTPISPPAQTEPNCRPKAYGKYRETYRPRLSLFLVYHPMRPRYSQKEWTVPSQIFASYDRPARPDPGPHDPAGSIVQIDRRTPESSSKRDWTHEFQRPIYFLRTPEGYVCGWCELDGNSEWLTLIPHPLSPSSIRIWKYREEVETLGRVIAVVIRSGERANPVDVAYGVMERSR